MVFTLEALRARRGDCLLLHYGPRERPLVALVDGGPAGTYKRALRPRLDELREALGDGGPLELQLVAVSHIDDDHIRGVLDLVRAVAEDRDAGSDPRYEILGLWHNSFEDVVGGPGPEGVPAAVAALGATRARVAAKLSEPARLVAASIPQGRDLRDAARSLALDVNQPFDGVVTAPEKVDWGDGLVLQVVGPDEERLHDLQRAWERDVRRRTPTEATVAAYLDESVYNLSSIVVLARYRRKKMLLTGDARGDDILAGLRAAGLLRRPPLRVDVLKLPHHGSDRNVETDFFRAIVADHYVASGDGSHHNPEIAALRMLSESRDDDDFVLHLTYRDGEKGLGERLRRFEREERRRGRRYEIHYADDEPGGSIVLDLLDPIANP